MDNIKRTLVLMDAPELTVLITGDFSFPFIEWKKMKSMPAIGERRQQIMER